MAWLARRIRRRIRQSSEWLEEPVIDSGAMTVRSLVSAGAPGPAV